MPKKSTWTKNGTTHERRSVPLTMCGLPIPYKEKIVKKAGQRRRKKKRIEKDRHPKPVTCIDCLARMGNEPLRINITEALRGLSADRVYIDEPMELSCSATSTSTDKA